VLELAAARIHSLSLEQIHARLDNRFRLLTDGGRTALLRQKNASRDTRLELRSPRRGRAPGAATAFGLRGRLHARGGVHGRLSQRGRRTRTDRRAEAARFAVAGHREYERSDRMLPAARNDPGYALEKLAESDAPCRSRRGYGPAGVRC
jgi:hypothetical protein